MNIPFQLHCEYHLNKRFPCEYCEEINRQAELRRRAIAGDEAITVRAIKALLDKSKEPAVSELYFAPPITKNVMTTTEFYQRRLFPGRTGMMTVNG